MSRIKQLRDKKLNLVIEADGLAAKAADGSITAEERARLNAIVNGVAASDGVAAVPSELDAVSADIATEEKLMDARRTMAPGAAINDDTATEAAARTSVPAEPKKTFATLGEQLCAIVRAGQKLGIDERLQWSASAGMNEGGGQDGGFLVQQDFVTGLIERAYDGSIFLPRTRQIQVSANSNGVKFNAVKESSRVNGSRFGGIQAFWTGEGQEKLGSTLKFRQMDMRLHKLTGLLYATDELLDDAPALEGLIDQGFSDEFGFKIDWAIFEGSGTGMPLGVTRSNAMITVPKESGQAADTVVVENIARMWARMWARSRPTSIWTINQQIEPQLMTMKIGDTPIYLPAGSIAGSPFSTLLGRPIIPTEFNNALGDAGDITLLDLNEYVTIQKGTIKKDVSIHARFINDETAFRFVIRMDGQPIWESPLTPLKGSDTLSPFVQLADRA